MRAFRSSSVSSGPSSSGGSSPISRATPWQAWRQVKRTWCFSGSMSGASRASVRASGAEPDVRACSAPLSIRPESPRSMGAKVWTAKACKDTDMAALPAGAVDPRSLSPIAYTTA